MKLMCKLAIIMMYVMVGVSLQSCDVKVAGIWALYYTSCNCECTKDFNVDCHVRLVRGTIYEWSPLTKIGQPIVDLVQRTIYSGTSE